MIVAIILLVTVAGCGSGPGPPTRNAPPARPGIRISMTELHRTGGVPPGWTFTPPPGDPTSGRRLFVELGCSSCHAVAGEPAFGAKPGQPGVGPELTGMGSHHPPGYFAESIMNPDAVLVDGPGYIGPDGHSIMPSYPDLTIAQLADLVAYLESLKGGGLRGAMAAPVSAPADVPPAAPETPTRFYVQSYAVNPGRLPDFERWLHDEGFARLFGYPGLVSVETWVDLAHGGPPLTTVFGFTDAEALANFLDDPRTEELGAAFDASLGPHGHQVFLVPPLYRAASLSAERPAP